MGVESELKAVSVLDTSEKRYSEKIKLNTEAKQLYKKLVNRN